MLIKTTILVKYNPTHSNIMKNTILEDLTERLCEKRIEGLEGEQNISPNISNYMAEIGMGRGCISKETKYCKVINYVPSYVSR